MANIAYFSTLYTIVCWLLGYFWLTPLAFSGWYARSLRSLASFFNSMLASLALSWLFLFRRVCACQRTDTYIYTKNQLKLVIKTVAVGAELLDKKK